MKHHGDHLFFVFLLFSVATHFLLGSDLANVAGKNTTLREKDDREARHFVAQLVKNDPVYYPSKSGLKTFSCKIRIPMMESLREKIRKQMPEYTTADNWHIDYYWSAPRLYHCAAPPWYKGNLGIDASPEDIAVAILDFSPVDWDRYFLKYTPTTESSYSHILKTINRDMNHKNYASEYYFDKDFLMQKIVQQGAFGKVIVSNFRYDKCANGMVLMGYRIREINSSIMAEIRIGYTTRENFTIPSTIDLDISYIGDGKSIHLDRSLHFDFLQVECNPVLSELIRGKLDAM